MGTIIKEVMYREIAKAKNGALSIYMMFDDDGTPFFNLAPSDSGYFDLSALLKLKGLGADDFVFADVIQKELGL